MDNDGQSKPLEQRINDEESSISAGTQRVLACNKPFMFLENLSIYGDNKYGVDREKSFMFGVDSALDYYNVYKKQADILCLDSVKLESLKHGARCIIRYVANNMTINEEYDLEDDD